MSNWRKQYNRNQELGPEMRPIDNSGTLEIEYMHALFVGHAPVDLKVTISYRYWSIDTESVQAEYKIIGSANYLPKNFNQLVMDYINDMPEMKGLTVGVIQKNLSC